MYPVHYGTDLAFSVLVLLQQALHFNFHITMENCIRKGFLKGSSFLTSFFMKSYWVFFFHSFNYHSEHTEKCFIKESHASVSCRLSWGLPPA